jgi:hypothetical protein
MYTIVYNIIKIKKAIDQEVINMRVTMYLDNKKITKKKAIEIFGKEIIDKRIKESKEVYCRDRYEVNSWMAPNFQTFEIKISE